MIRQSKLKVCSLYFPPDNDKPFVAVDKTNSNTNVVKCTTYTPHLLAACLWVILTRFINLCVDLYHQHTY